MSRLRANKITNQLADGSPTVEKGLIIAGVTTVTTLDLNGDLDVDGHTNLDNVNIAGITTTGNLYANNLYANSSLTLNNNASVSVNLTSTSTTGSSRIFFGDPDSALVGRINYGHNGDYMQFYTAYSEKLRITSGGKVLIGSSNHNTLIGAGVGSQLQVEGNTYQTSSLALINNQTSTDPAFLLFGKSRAGTAGGNTIVQNGDRLGGIRWCGEDGSDLHSIASTIESYVDGAPGSNDLPGRLVFATTPD